MNETAAMAETPECGYLSGAEIGAALEALSEADKLKLSAIDDVMRGGTGFGKNDLIQEAACRALDGRRRCPRDVAFMAFLIETMRSVASHEREKRSRMVYLAEVGETVERGGAHPAAAAQGPEADLIEKQTADIIQAIHAALGDDPEAQLVLMGWAEELRGGALRDATGLDQGQIDYAKRRIRTKVKKMYLEGAIT